jgi:hypothetical protein
MPREAARRNGYLVGGRLSTEVILSERSEAKDPTNLGRNATGVLRFAQDDLGANRNPAGTQSW